MSFLGNALSGLSMLAPAPTADFWYQPTGQQTAAGIKITDDIALTYSAVACATRVLGEGVGILPCELFQRKPDGGKRPATEHPLYRIVHSRPNSQMSPIHFKEQETARLVNSGNSYSEIQRTQGNRIANLWPIHPSRVTPNRRSDGTVYYDVRQENGSCRQISWENMLHVPGTLSDDSLTGKGVITLARENIAMGLTTERFGQSFFRNNAKPGGIIEHPGKLKDIGVQNLRRSWNAVHQGSGNVGNVGILEEGAKFHELGFNAEDAQFLQTRNANITDFARWYRIPPHMLYDLLRSTNNNIEHQGAEFITYSLMPWLVRWEESMSVQLLTEAEQQEYFFEFNVSALLRGDAVARATAFQIKFQNSATTVNEYRAMENENSIGPEGDKRFVMANLKSLETVACEEVAAQCANDAAMNPPAAMPEAVGETETDLQADAYAAGQITAMTAIAVTVATGQITPESAKAQLRLAFPEADETLIAGIIDPIEVKEAPDVNTNETPPKTDNEDPAAPGEPNDSEDPKAPGEMPAGAGQSNNNGLAALAGLMADVTQRMLKIEAVEAIRAAKHPAKFCGWIDSFYAKHEGKVAESAKPVCLAISGKAIEGYVVAKRHCDRSKAELLEVAGTATPAKLEAAVQAWADGLSSRWNVDVFEAQLADGQIGVAK